MIFIDPQRYIQALERAPTALRQISGSEETTQVMRSIGDRYELGGKIGDVARITAYVLIGLAPLTKFRETIQEEAELDEDTARKVAHEIRERVFSRVVDDLRAIHGL